jgi:hypothetical protein
METIDNDAVTRRKLDSKPSRSQIGLRLGLVVARDVKRAEASAIRSVSDERCSVVGDDGHVGAVPRRDAQVALVPILVADRA